MSSKARSEERASKTGALLSVLSWIFTLAVVLFVAYYAWQTRFASAARLEETPVVQLAPQGKMQAQAEVAIPPFIKSSAANGVVRKTLLHTSIPNRPKLEVTTYTVRKGDSLFEIANNFKIKPETLLWANYDLLNDNPDLITLGMELKVPPVDGVYYEWQEGDTMQTVAGRFEAKIQDILSWTSNQIDLTEQAVEPGTWVMVPGGHREFRQWIIPVIPRGRAGVSKSVYGAGACEGGYDGAYGSGAFIWPAGNHYLSGNDYWSGHLGIDIAAGEGAPVYAADSGVIVFSGWATGGYGYMIMIDHGNGYQTLYAHLSNTSASCGASVGQGGIVGYSGSTGNSTGAHLHFEVRYQGGFVDPWYVLPAP